MIEEITKQVFKLSQNLEGHEGIAIYMEWKAFNRLKDKVSLPVKILGFPVFAIADHSSNKHPNYRIIVT